MDEKQADAIRDFEHAARSFHIIAEETDDVLLCKLDYNTKAGLAKTLEDIVRRSKEILEALSVSCSYCRQGGGRYLGKCAQCGREVCSLCGRLYDGEPLHSSVCSLWYKKKGAKGQETPD